jgi:hypothetical protein
VSALLEVVETSETPWLCKAQYQQGGGAHFGRLARSIDSLATPRPSFRERESKRWFAKETAPGLGRKCSDRFTPSGARGAWSRSKRILNLLFNS